MADRRRDDFRAATAEFQLAVKHGDRGFRLHRFETFDQREQPRDIKGIRCALAREQAARFQDRVIIMEAVHRHDHGRAFAPRVQRLRNLARKPRFPRSGRADNRGDRARAGEALDMARQIGARGA